MAVKLVDCINEYLREKTASKSAGTRAIQLEISLQQSIERARRRREYRGKVTPYKHKAGIFSGTQYFDRLALGFFRGTMPAEIELADINVGHLLRHRRALLEPKDPRKKPIKPQSVLRREHTIQNFFNFAVALKYIPESPMLKLERLRPSDETQRRSLRPKEVRRLLFGADPWLFAPLLFGAVTGARRAQICFFTFGSIVWEKCEARFEARRGFNPKNRKTNIVPLPPRMLTILRNLHRKARMQGRGGPNDFVFSGSRGEFITPDRLTKAVSRLIRKVLGPGADVGAAVHALRRTAATIWHERGASLVECQTLLGHSSSKTTERYIRTSSERLRKIVKSSRF